MTACTRPAALAIVAFPGKHPGASLRPRITPSNRTFHLGIAEGAIWLPRCSACGRTRGPQGACCPWCCERGHVWLGVSGRGTVHSAVRYHRALVPQFEDVVPYGVLAVALEEGPVLLGRWVGRDDLPEIGSQVQAVVERWSDGFCSLGFGGID